MYVSYNDLYCGIASYKFFYQMMPLGSGMVSGPKQH